MVQLADSIGCSRYSFISPDLGQGKQLCVYKVETLVRKKYLKVENTNFYLTASTSFPKHFIHSVFLTFTSLAFPIL